MNHEHNAVLKTVIAALFVVFLAAASNAQNLLVNGGFDDDSGWIVYDMGSNDPSEYEFGFTADTCLFGSGPCLDVFGASGYTNILFWQELKLVAGNTYQASGAFKHLSGDVNLGFWCQFYISTDGPPVEGVDYKPPADANTDIPLGFNSWSGCSGDGVDGTFQDDGCDGLNNPLWIAPGTPGDSVIVYLGVKMGVWSDQQTLEYEVLIDEVSLVDVTGTAVKNEQPHVARSYALEQNYPNPFNPQTSIRFQLPANDVVSLQVFDVSGRVVRTLVNGELTSGQHVARWDGRDDAGQMLSSGVYFYQMQTSQVVRTKKMTFLQ